MFSSSSCRVACKSSFVAFCRQELEQNEGKGIDYRQKLAELAEDETLAPGAATLNTMNYDLPQGVFNVNRRMFCSINWYCKVLANLILSVKLFMFHCFLFIRQARSFESNQ